MSSEAATADRLQQVMTQARSDRGFRRRLFDSPRAVFDEAGVPMPADVELRLVEDTADRTYLILPQAPAEGAVSDEDLNAATGGASPALATVGLLISITISVALTNID